MSSSKRVMSLLKPFCTECDDHTWPQKDCPKCQEMAKLFKAELEDNLRQGRLDELDTIFDALHAGAEINFEWIEKRRRYLCALAKPLAQEGNNADAKL